MNEIRESKRINCLVNDVSYNQSKPKRGKSVAPSFTRIQTQQLITKLSRPIFSKSDLIAFVTLRWNISLPASKETNQHYLSLISLFCSTAKELKDKTVYNKVFDNLMANGHFKTVISIMHQSEGVLIQLSDWVVFILEMMVAKDEGILLIIEHIHLVMRSLRFVFDK